MFSDADVEQLKNNVRGEVVLPADPTFDNIRRVHNAMIDRRPAIIVCCNGVADVLASVRFARERQLVVAVRGAGHNVAGLSVCDDGMLIDLSRMKGIRVDVAARAVRVEPGATWAEVNHELQVFGLAATGGFVGTTGVAGLTLGGGLGWLVRKHGLALDNLLSLDVVTADGRLLKASESENSDLFWGMRGGGGNFGIATSFEFRVHAVGEVLAGLVLHPLDRGRDALRYWRDFEATSPEELTNGALIFTPPDDLPVPDVLRPGLVGLGGVYSGAIAAGEQVLRPMRDFGPPAADTFQAMPYEAAQSMADFLWPRGQYNYWKSSYLKELSDEAIDLMLEWYRKVPSSRTVVVLEHNGNGAMDRVPDDATAFGDRSWPFNLLITSAWKDAAESEVNIRWTREFWNAMQPFFAPAVYVNYLGEQAEEEVRAAYGKKYERLVALKDKHDPNNFFCMNQNIKPSARTASPLARTG